MNDLPQPLTQPTHSTFPLPDLSEAEASSFFFPFFDGIMDGGGIDFKSCHE